MWVTIAAAEIRGQAPHMRIWTPIALIAATTLIGCSPTTDSAMISTFNAKRLVFDEIRNRACALGRYQLIRPDGTDPQMTEADASWFKSKLSSVGASGLHVSQQKLGCYLQLDVWATGFAGTPAEYKQFRFGRIEQVTGPDVMTLTTSDLDHVKPGNKITQFERPLAGGWWLEYVSYP